MNETGPRLYAVYLGGELVPGRLGEDHEVVFVVAQDVPGARRAAKAKWRGFDRPHIDAVRELDVVDGYELSLRPTALAERAVVDTTYVVPDA